MSSGRLKEIDTTMQAFIVQGTYAGIATLIARRGKVVQFGCYGKLDLAADKPLQPDSLFRIYSLTKLVTSAAALMLHEEGRFNLDDPVYEWIPEFKDLRVLKDSTRSDGELVALEKPITFLHLLTHTAGLGYGSKTEPIEEIYREAEIFSPILALRIPLPEVVQKVARLPLVTQPGVAWHYSLAHDVLGYLIGLISGKPFDVFLRERIFEPLGMHDTGFYVPSEKLERFGPMYRVSDEVGLSVLDGVTTSPFVRPDTVPSGGDGLVSSIPDYARFLLTLASGGALDGVRLLKPDTVTTMITNQLSGPAFPVGFNNKPWTGMGYGLGVGVQVTDRSPDKPSGTWGWLGDSGTAAWIDPREAMIVLSMSQS